MFIEQKQYKELIKILHQEMLLRFVAANIWLILKTSSSHKCPCFDNQAGRAHAQYQRPANYCTEI